MNRNVLIALVVMVAASTNNCGDCTREVSDVAYRGDPNATAPYVEDEGLEYSQHCDQSECTYFMTATAWLHNPLDVSYTTDVVCTFFDDDYQIGTSTREDIEIGGHRSKELQFSEQHSSSLQVNLSFSCELAP